MITNYVNEQHDTWDQFLREFAYAIRKAVNETTGKTPAELFLGRKLITPFQKLVMVTDGTEFAVVDIERLFEEARRNTKAKHEKWKKYYNRRRVDVQIKVRIYRHRKCDETEIGTGSSDNCSLRDASSGFDRVQRRSKESQDGKKKGSEKEKPKKRNSNAQNKRLKPQTTKWKKSGVPTNHREEDTTRRTSSIQKSRGRNDNPCIEERTRSNNRNARRGGDQQRQGQERKGACTRRSLSLEVLVGNANYKS
ncbi:uncharacterized protein TNCV_3936221 [Trichonephila clavipes]|nr:uncharacterized protein TNCV_3936221 [Trichonephila clavipes]